MLMAYRAAVIGCGRIGSEFSEDPRAEGIYSHAEAYSVCPRTTLSAVCDCDPDKLGRCAERWGVSRRDADPLRMLAEVRPDIVSICTPDATHYDLIRAAIGTPGVRAILAEKPLAMELDAAQELVRLAAESHVLLAVNYTRRYSQNHARLKEFLGSGGLGDIQGIGGYYTKGTLHNGTHWFDLARFLVGEVSQVRGFVMRCETGDDPTLAAFLDFASGAKACVLGCDAGAFSIFEMDLVGTRGRARLVDAGHAIELYGVGESAHYTGYRSLTQTGGISGGMGDVLLHAVEDVVHCLDERARPRCSGEDGVAALEIALAVRESARSGRPVQMRQG